MVSPTKNVHYTRLFICMEPERKKPDLSTRLLVRWARLELAQDYSHYPLKVACLPFHHHRF